jgi:hypothetical protein
VSSCHFDRRPPHGSPHSNISPLFVLHDAGPLICSHVIDQIITAIAKKFNDTLSLYNIIWDCNTNSSSIALVATPKGHPHPEDTPPRRNTNMTSETRKFNTGLWE